MAAYLKPEIQAFTAGADLSALQYSFVKFGADLEKVVGCGNDEIPMGILMNAPTSGQMAEVAVAGGAKLKSSGVIGLNASIGSAASGQGKAITTGAAFAVAMQDAVQNDVIAVIIDRHVGRSV